MPHPAPLSGTEAGTLSQQAVERNSVAENF